MERDGDLREAAGGSADGITITADGGPKGSGSYQYQQGFIYKYDPYIWIYDPTFPPAETFRDSNVLSYQFVGAGRYQYQFVVRDTGRRAYMLILLRGRSCWRWLHRCE